jgi:hypothetical protein
MFKIERSSNGEVIFRLAGRLNEEQVAEMETLLRSSCYSGDSAGFERPELGRS